MTALVTGATGFLGSHVTGCSWHAASGRGC